MPNWDQAVSEISAGTTNIDIQKRHWAPWIPRTLIAITGSSGAGKTELWRRLTGRKVKDARSTAPDEGYYFPRRRISLALDTIPGQPSPERDKLLDELFGINFRLSGIVFVACYGYDYIWPSLSDMVAASDLKPDRREQRPYEHQLRDRNIRRELDNYRDTCNRIRQKTSGAESRNNRPRWLAVIANKADLYWPEIHNARNYYTFGCNSEFDEITQKLIEDTRNLVQFTYRVIPAIMNPIGYSFQSDLWSYETPSKLSTAASKASLHTVARTLEELCDI